MISQSEVSATFQIKELSGRTNVPAKTIRYYEAMGLLAPARRSSNGYRVYDEKDAERLAFIRSARTLNFSLAEIAKILAVRDRHEPPCQHVLDLIRVHLDEVEVRIHELQKLKRDLAALYQAGQDLPEDVLMGACVCHLIRVRVSAGAKGT
jgi:DNA-binding transcriptional MerR regulator